MRSSPRDKVLKEERLYHRLPPVSQSIISTRRDICCIIINKGKPEKDLLLDGQAKKSATGSDLRNNKTKTSRRGRGVEWVWKRGLVRPIDWQWRCILYGYMTVGLATKHLCFVGFCKRSRELGGSSRPGIRDPGS